MNCLMMKNYKNLGDLGGTWRLGGEVERSSVVRGPSSIVGISRAQLAAGRAYRPYGNARELFRRRDAEIILDGPAGTGKSRAVLEKVNAVLARYGGARAVMVRKYKSTLTQTARVTFERLVLPVGSPVKFNSTAQEYR